MDGSTSAKRELEGDNIDEQTNVFHSLSDLDAVLHEPSPPQACITKNGPWGGNTGESHEINVELEPAYLHSITLRSGETIHAIAFSFSDKDGNPHHAGPWGATAHQPTGSFDTILLGPTEHLIKISGTVGMSTQHSCDVVTSLTFSTNISVYGPFGREDGIPFSFQTMGIGSIVGFFVRAMAMVNAIATYVNSTRQPMRTRGLIMKIGPWGSNGGTLFDVDVLPRRLVSMVIRSGKLIDSISFTYSDCDGQQHIAGPWGGHGTHDRDDGSIHTIVLGRSEFLKKISGTIGPSPHPYLVNSLLFITNTGSYGPFGRGRGIPFCSPVLTNSSIVGFFVRSGWYIDAIGLYVDAIEETDNGGASSASPNPEGQIEELNMPCITKIGLWGGEKGSLRDIDVSPICLNSIKICSGEVIHSFAFSYSDDHGKQHHAGPWGSYEGSFDMIQLGPSELLIQVSGTVGSFSRYTQDVAVTSLTFTTNARRYGPFGRGGGVQFHSPGMSNGNITGFFARSGGVIDAIGIYVNRGQAMEKRGLIRKIGPWGRTKGKPKDIEETPLYLNSVTIRSGELVYSLAFSYTDGHGKQHHAGPWGSYEVSSYGNFHTIQLSPSEFLTEVSGTIGFPPRYPAHVVTSVKFITNARGIGPFGTGGGHHFRSPPLSKGSIVGFFAYVGKALNAIGLYVNPEKQPIREPGLATKVGPWGGDSGRSGDVAVLPQRLISVVVCSGKVINSLSFTYSGCDGQVHTAGPWGGMDESQGGSSDTILLGDSEILMKISGTVGQSPDHLDVVTSLLFVTNVRSYGRYGEGGGNRFQSPRQRDGGIVGFFANAGDVIGAIGVYFSPQGETIDEEEEGGSGTSDLMASRERDTKPASSTLETIILDKRAEPTNLPLALFQYITGNFADEREIGRGGFGVVYKGDLDNGSSVAVKRLLNCHIIDEKEFNLEASSLIGVNHKNIVRFLGYCANTESKAMLIPESGGALKYIFAEIRERLLCFEYISNGSLEQYLTDELKGLEWHKRYQIIRGICEGLVYLHKETDIVHMDMKPANILLDDLMIPKISDFGISKILEGATHAVTANRKWSLGYCAPEFINSGEVSTKLDIYSLGIIITELLTGCKGNLDIEHVLRRWRYRWNKSVNYPPFGYEQVKLCTEIALRCLSNSPRERPQIWDIVSMLDTIESTNEQINNASDSPVELISPYPWELLEFDMLELNFPFEINKQIPCSLQLKNVTDDYIAFDTKTAGRLQYSIEPEKGVVPPRSKCDVMVKLQAQERAPNATTCKDEFFMRCAAVNEGVTALDITEDMFDKNSGKLVDEVTLKVIIEPLANA